MNASQEAVSEVFLSPLKALPLMKQQLRCLILLALVPLLSSCMFDSGIEWRGGPYVLVWLDTSENTSLCRELGKGSWIGRVDSTVFAVGWDGRYLVAKQHPRGDRSKTNYFIVDAKNDTPYLNADEVTIGPLTALEFQQKTIEMKLPKFSNLLDSLQ